MHERRRNNGMRIKEMRERERINKELDIRDISKL